MKPRKKSESVSGRSKGAVMLARTGLTQEAIAREAGVSSVAVHHWMTGKSKPTEAKRRALEKKRGIVGRWWDEEPDAPSRAVQTSTSRIAETDRPETLLGKAGRAEEWAYDTLAEVMSDKQATPNERAKMLLQVTASFANIQRMRGETPITMKKLLESQDLRRVVDAITEAIRPWPPALAAALEAVRALNAEEAAA